MISIRLADFKADALIIMEGARDCVRRHKEHQGDLNIGSIFPDDDKVLIAALDKIVSFDGLEVLIAEDEKRVVGGIGVLYIPYLWNPELLSADQLFWWAVEDAPFRTEKILFDEAMRRIEERNAMPIIRVLKTSPKGLEKLCQKVSMVPVETMYMRLP